MIMKRIGGMMLLAVVMMVLIVPTVSAVSVDLYAGQNELVGNVDVSNDESNLTVTYNLYEPWVMTEAHLSVGNTSDDIPQATGNPTPGQFEYKESFDPGVSTYTFEISLDAIPNDGDIAIAAHAVVEIIEEVYTEEEGTTTETREETAWGAGSDFDGDNWATYFEYILGTGEIMMAETEIREETAWGEGSKFDGSNWAMYFEYSLGGSDVSVDLYAGQNELMGNVTVSNDGTNLTVTYNLDESWMMTEAHLSVGNTSDDIPQATGNPTPGQFEYKESFDEGVSTYTFVIPLEEIPGNDGDIVIAAHADVETEVEV
ncbi:MAG: hypothetical protein K0A90_05680 [Methanosarcinaceae archaeon]|nr:hypothetical protein [Methanosarcinaceae archaeon]